MTLTVASREARQTAALVDLLQALPETQLEAVLDGLGIAPARREAMGRKPDTRRCTICGLGWYRCSTTWASDHEFSPHPGPPADPETVKAILADPEAVVTKADAAEEFDAWASSGARPSDGLASEGLAAGWAAYQEGQGG